MVKYVFLCLMFISQFANAGFCLISFQDNDDFVQFKSKVDAPGECEYKAKDMARERQLDIDWVFVGMDKKSEQALDTNHGAWLASDHGRIKHIQIN